MQENILQKLSHKKIISCDKHVTSKQTKAHAMISICFALFDNTLVSWLNLNLFSLSSCIFMVLMLMYTKALFGITICFHYLLLAFKQTHPLFPPIPPPPFSKPHTLTYTQKMPPPQKKKRKKKKEKKTPHPTPQNTKTQANKTKPEKHKKHHMNILFHFLYSLSIYP